MKSYSRVLLALAVLAGGIGMALLFRLEQNETAPPTSRDDLQVASRAPNRSPQAANNAPTQSPQPSESSNRADPAPPPAARQETAADSSRPAETPRLSDQSNSSGRSSPNRATERNGLGRRAPSKAALRPLRTHKIVDGDSLQEIARQYLGSASLAGEIYEVNRDRLSDPALLPIGVELTIPSGVQSATTTPGSPNRRPLVPVSPRPRDQSASVGPVNR